MFYAVKVPPCILSMTMPRYAILLFPEHAHTFGELFYLVAASQHAMLCRDVPCPALPPPPPPDCWSMPHMIHVAVACLSLIVFVALAASFTMAEVELNPLSKNPLATAHSRWVGGWVGNEVISD